MVGGDRKTALVALLAALTLTSVAHAQPAPASPPAPAPSPAPAGSPAPPAGAQSRADALFQQGKQLLEQGKFVEACDLLAQSDKLDPSVSALGLLATCHEQQGRIATAWREYMETVKRAEATRDDRGAFAKQRAAAIEPRLPRIAIRVPKAIAGLEVRRDGEIVEGDALGASIAVDPGAHEIAFSAPGRQEQRIRLSSKESAVITIDAPDLAIVAAPAACPPPPEPASARLGARVPAAIALGGLGLAGLGVGIGFGAHAMDRNAASKSLQDLCGNPNAPRGACAAGKDAREGAFRAATFSTVGFIAGGVSVGVAIALLAWPKGRAAAPKQGGLDVTPLVGTDGGGASVRGTF